MSFTVNFERKYVEMAEDKQTGSAFTGGNWILLAAAAVGTVYVSLQQPPLEGSRPTTTLEFEVPDRDNIQHVDAHLWQDALAASVQHSKDEEKEGEAQKSRCCYGTQDGALTLQKDQQSHSIKTLSQTVRDRKPALIVGIAVPGGPYAEDSEARLRLRYAVVSALDVAKYVPYDEDHIGYLDTNSDAQESAPNAVFGASTASERPPNLPRQSFPDHVRPPLPDIIPFEWFHKGNYLDPNNFVLLLWIDERSLFTSPISSLADLQCQIDSSSLEGAGRGFALIGPQQSRTLARMAAELHRGPPSTRRLRTQATVFGPG